MFKIFLAVGTGVLLSAIALGAQNRPAFSEITRQFISVDAPVVALEHVRVIDGTGGPVTENQTIVIENGTIRAIGPDNSVSVPPTARVMDLSGRTVFPGLVGMHDHVVYAQTSPSAIRAGAPTIYFVPTFTFPRLYLAAGVTTIRTTGTWEPDTDLNLKKQIDAGNMPGPTMFVTGPFLDGSNSMFQDHVLTGPEDATRQVNFWADDGVNNFKVYQGVTKAELAAVIKAAHARGLKVTGHLCTVGFREAIDLGIDGLEHGLRVDTEFDPNKKPDTCPAAAETSTTIANLDLKSAPVQNLIHQLIDHHVSITSTLVVWEPSATRPIQPGALLALSPQVLTDFLMSRVQAEQASRNPTPQALQAAAIFKKEKEFEHDFVKAGGWLMAGPDADVNAGIAGYGDQRELELLVDAEFTPSEAIQIASLNGAKWLGIADKVGSVQVGKQADLVIVKGNPAQRIQDIENVETVFKNGVGFDSQKLLQSVQGQVGIR